MTNSPAGQGAAELLIAPVISDDDVLGRVAAVISPAARHRRTLWLLFLDRDGTQADRVMPVDGLPDRPGAAAGTYAVSTTVSFSREMRKVLKAHPVPA